MTQDCDSPAYDILVVDDNAPLRRVICRELAILNGVCCEAENGLQGLEFAASRSFDLILTDVDMPKMDGLHMLTMIRTHPFMHQPYIIVMSGVEDPHMARRCFERRADDFLAKPFTFERLKRAVERFARLSSREERPLALASLP